MESGQSWMHSKIVPAELLSFMAKYTLPLTTNLQNHITTNIFDVVRIVTSKQQIFSVRSSPDPPILKKIAVRSSPDPAKIGFSLDPVRSSPDPCSSLLPSM